MRRTWFLAGVIGGVVLCGRASAATFTVDSTEDAVDSRPGDGKCATSTGACTLRAAIQETNALSGADTIVLPAGNYVLSIPGPAEDAAASGDLDITDSLTISGAGAATTVVDGAQLDRVFHVDPTAKGIRVTLEGITIQHGKTTLISYVSASGAGVLLGTTATQGNPVPSGTLTMRDCVVRDNASAAYGGGLTNNAGTMTLERTEVRNNLGGLGGGIANGDQGVLMVVDSTIADNTGPGGGGGVFSGLFDISPSATRVTLTRTTLSGNHTSGEGGGLWMNRGLLAASDSTFSGNVAFSGGGLSMGNYQTGSVSSCTVAANHAGVANSGGGGGGVAAGTNLTLRNTLIAGNTTEVAAPDCGGTPTSAGYNLVQNTTGCTLQGNAPGDRTGVDPLLAPLADNGGRTRTHALEAGSPAIDHGNPAAPGSGPDACPAADQRGILRPRRAACDIGAFEEQGGFAVSGVTPRKAGNVGTVLAAIAGTGFQPGAAVKLKHSGSPDVAARAVTLAGDALASALLDVGGLAPGAWDVEVDNPDGSTARLPAALTLAVPSGPRLWLQLLGRTVVRPGGDLLFLIVYGNDGDQDAFDVPVGLSATNGSGLTPAFDVAVPPPHAGQVPFDWRAGHLLASVGSTGLSLPLVVSTIPAGGGGVLPVVVHAGSSLASGASFQLAAGMGQPLAGPDLTSLGAAVDGLVAAAQAYAQAAFGVTVPPGSLPQLSTYAAEQLAAVAADGRAAVVAGFGSAPVHSLATLTEDVALYALKLAAGAHATVRPSPVHAGGGFQPNPGACTLIIPRGAICPAGCICTSPSPGPQPPIPPECQNPQDAMDGKCQPPPALCEKLSGVRVDPGSGTCTPCSQDPKSCQPPWPIQVLFARDPNAKVGPPGVGDARFIAPDARLAWAIEFENLSTATAPAQRVVVSDTLDPALVDLDTLQFGPVAFGQTSAVLASSGGSSSIVLDLRPATPLMLSVDALLDRTSSQLRWALSSLDPVALVLTQDPTAGFLPPNRTPPAGEGAVGFTVMPRSGLATGTKICNRATVVFDTNAPIDTPTWCNTIDATKPVSRVDALPAEQSGTSFAVHWTASDEGSGVLDVSIWVSEDGGPAAPWVENNATGSAKAASVCTARSPNTRIAAGHSETA